MCNRSVHVCRTCKLPLAGFRRHWVTVCSNTAKPRVAALCPPCFDLLRPHALHELSHHPFHILLVAAHDYKALQVHNYRNRAGGRRNG